MVVYVLGILHEGDTKPVIKEALGLGIQNPTIFIEAKPQQLGGIFPFKWWRDLALGLVKHATVIPLESRKRREVKFNLPKEILQPDVPAKINPVKKHPQEIARERYWAERIF